MDQDAFRKTYREMNDRECIFEKSLLSSHCRCSMAKRLYIAEREGIHCESSHAQRECATFLNLLRHQARFVLKENDDHEILAHGKAMRIQVGGLRGLYNVLYPDDAIPVQLSDIAALIEQALLEYNDYAQLPFQKIIKEIAAFKGRKRLR